MPSLKVLNIVAFLSAIIAIYLDFIDHISYDLFKPLTTILVILIPIIHGNRKLKNYLYLTIVALLFCLIGDILLLRESQFVWGLAAFLIAHLLFMFSFIAIDKFKLYFSPLIILSLIGLGYYLFIYDELKGLAIPVLFYFIFIIVMCWQGLSLYLWKKKWVFKLIGIAVLLFLFSDSMIAFSKFKVSFSWSGLLVLATYWLSISLLANASVLIDEEN